MLRVCVGMSAVRLPADAACGGASFATLSVFAAGCAGFASTGVGASFFAGIGAVFSATVACAAATAFSVLSAAGFAVVAGVFFLLVSGVLEFSAGAAAFSVAVGAILSV